MNKVVKNEGFLSLRLLHGCDVQFPSPPQEPLRWTWRGLGTAEVLFFLFISFSFIAGDCFDLYAARGRLTLCRGRGCTEL